jgi:alpha-ketoglutarate-dependent taurine dioxygenase
MTIAPVDLTTDLAVRRLSATIGAEICGVDLKGALDPGSVAALRALLLEHRVIFFREQHLEPEEHLALARFLNAVTIAEAAGDTQWSNQQAAFEGLSPALREFLRTLTAVHDGRSQFGWILELQEGPEWEGKRVVTLDPFEHPLIRTHEETGEPVLFVNPGFTSHIKELAPAESRALLQFLYEHSTRPQYTVRWHWSEGDLAFWDNRVTQHAVVPDFSGQHRVMRRVTLRGTEPV